jgi:hypothetical protein
MQPLTPALRNAARWLARQDWKQSPAYWVSQAQTRYSLTQAQTDLLLYSMQLQLGQN